MTNTNTTNNTKKRDREEEEEPDQASPYQELKWNHAPPLFLNDKFDNPNELLQNEKTTPPIHAGRTALLVVDVQPEYWSHCPAVRQDFPDFPKHLERLVAQCRKQKAKIIWVRADYRYAHSPWLVQFARLHQGTIPAEVHSSASDCETIPWEDFATPQGGEYVIPKTSWSSTRHTALMDLLKQSGIDTVLVCGLITSVCVQHSAFGIFEAGYRTLLVTDACADRGKARHDAALALYGDYMYELLTVQDLCQKDKPFYLRPAQPVWLTKESVDNLVQPTFFNSLQDSIVTKQHEEQHEEQEKPNKVAKVDHHPIFYKMPTTRTTAATTVSVATEKQDNKKVTIHPTDSNSSLSTMTSPVLAGATEPPAPPGTIRV
ncbi:Isochorismatase family [Seminavis robusta]|uniref:Isochorismatase family n=1 Tax=Seminavis robusta TaxID=568900 RepID=A0A9N8HS96_9STRA|nr:Isochorismatase family [Seminavis robusta]|eukprot:Sro1688_g291240.1 Isochorismatase family (374) ;mRNA; f:8791-9912